MRGSVRVGPNTDRVLVTRFLCVPSGSIAGRCARVDLEKHLRCPTCGIGPKGRMADGQSMSALPRWFRRQLAQKSRARRQPRYRDVGLCFRSWYDRARAARLANFPCAGKSTLPLSGVGSGCQILSGQVRCLPPSWREGEHIDALSSPDRDHGGHKCSPGLLPVSFKKSSTACRV